MPMWPDPVLIFQVEQPANTLVALLPTERVDCGSLQNEIDYPSFKKLVEERLTEILELRDAPKQKPFWVNITILVDEVSKLS